MSDLDKFKKEIATDSHYAKKWISSGRRFSYNGATFKRKYTDPVPEKAWAFIIVGYCPNTLMYYQAMYEEAKKSFPNLKPEDVTCSVVTKSDSIYGHTIIKFDVPNKEVKGWSYYDSPIDFNFAC